MTNSIKVNIQYLRNSDKSGNILEYSTSYSAGIDLRAFMEPESVYIDPGSRYPFPTGICMEIQTPGIAGFVYSRSGLGTKYGLVVSQGVGVIDPDYRGEIIVSLLNNSSEGRTIKKTQRIAQLIFQPFFHGRLITAQQLSPSSRGSGGFGHTGSL